MKQVYVTYYYNGDKQKWKCHTTLEKALKYKTNIEKQRKRITVFIAKDL